MSLIGTEPHIPHEQILKVMNTITEAKTVGELFKPRREIVQYTACSYHLLPQIGAFEYDGKGKYWTDSLPDPIKKYYDSNNGKTDPATDFTLSKGMPFWLTELREIVEFVTEKSKYLVDSTIELTGDGLVIPLFGPYHKHGCVFLSFQNGRDFYDDVYKWQVQTLAQAAHVKYCIIANSLNKFIRLTNRESEVLELITFGKTNPEIGNILGISTSTVSGYVKQIFLKLDVSDRVSAALRARSFNLSPQMQSESLS